MPISRVPVDGTCSKALARNLSLRLWHLAHQGQKVVIDVPKEGHPEVVVLHGSDQGRYSLEARPPIDEHPVGGLDVLHPEIDYGARMVELALLGNGEHEADSIGIEKGHVSRNIEEVLHAEGVPVKSGGFGQVVHVDGDLPNGPEAGESGGVHVHVSVRVFLSVVTLPDREALI